MMSEVYSGGEEPPVRYDPEQLRLLEEAGIDTSGLTGEGVVYLDLPPAGQVIPAPEPDQPVRKKRPETVEVIFAAEHLQLAADGLVRTVPWIRRERRGRTSDDFSFDLNQLLRQRATRRVLSAPQSGEQLRVIAGDIGLHGAPQEAALKLLRAWWRERLRINTYPVVVFSGKRQGWRAQANPSMRIIAVGGEEM